MSKELLAELESRKLINYGSVISGRLVRKILGLEYPIIATKREFDQLALAELGAVDYVRNVLLGRGMYIASGNGDYRILLPSENKRQVELYMRSADQKLRRAFKLSTNTNTPRMVDTEYKDDQVAARILLKRIGIRRGVPCKPT